MTINHILRTAALGRLHEARKYVADLLNIDIMHVTRETAVAYIQKHFETVGYSGWDGWVEMIDADEASMERAARR